MQLMQEEKINLQGWALFSNIERPHAALVMRDSINSAIKGVRYQIIPAQNVGDEKDVAPSHHKFIFETWNYKARGAIQHQTFLSFYLQNRQRYDTRVLSHVHELKVLNRHYKENERLVLAALKCAASVIDHINYAEHFDVYHMLQSYQLIEEHECTSLNGVEEEKETKSYY